MPNTIIIIEQQTRSLLRTFSSLEQVNTPTFVHGETLPVELYLVRRRTAPTSGGKWVDQLSLASHSARIAIGTKDADVLGGTWQWVWGADSVAIPYSATAAQMQTLINGGAAMTAAGGCTVTAIGDLFSVRWNTVGARSAPVPDPSLLVPPSIVETAMLAAGSASTRACAVLQVVQQPAAICDLSSATASLTASVATVRQGTVSPPVNHLARVTFAGGLPIDGFWTLSVVVPSVAATLTTAMTGNDNDVRLTAIALGTGGNSISLTLVDPNGNNQALAVTVTGSDISVSLATGQAGAITTTASELVTAINADDAASLLVTAALAPGSAGTGIVTALTKTSLTGGATAPEVSAGISPNATEAEAEEVLDAMSAFGTGGSHVSKISEREWLVEWVGPVAATVPGTVDVQDDGLEVAAGLTGTLPLTTGALLLQMNGAESARLTMEVSVTPSGGAAQKVLSREVNIVRGLIDPSMVAGAPTGTDVAIWVDPPTTNDDWTMFEDEVMPTSGHYCASDGTFLYTFIGGVVGWTKWGRTPLALTW